MKKNDSDLPNLETSLTEITKLIEKMEKGELTLEQSLSCFEQGIHLVKHCQKILTEAEQKVQVLIQQNQQDTLVAYDEGDASGSTQKHPDDAA